MPFFYISIGSRLVKVLSLIIDHIQISTWSSSTGYARKDATLMATSSLLSNCPSDHILISLRNHQADGSMTPTLWNDFDIQSPKFPIGTRNRRNRSLRTSAHACSLISSVRKLFLSQYSAIHSGYYGPWLKRRKMTMLIWWRDKPMVAGSEGTRSKL
jgi:hypothetical protein